MSRSNPAIQHGRTTVATAGVAVQLTSVGTTTPSVTIQALSTNTGFIFVGNSSVSASDCIVELDSGGAFTIECSKFGKGDSKIDLSTIYIDSGVSGEGVNYGFLV